MNAPVPLDQLQTRPLQSNLSYLQSRNHELCRLLQNAPATEPIMVQVQGTQVRAQVVAPQRQWLFGGNDPVAERQSLEQSIRELPRDARLVILAGTSVVHALLPLLPRLLQEHDLHVVAIEPTPARIHLALALVDMWQVLATERLHFVVSDVTAEAMTNALLPLNVADMEPSAIWVAPELVSQISEADIRTRWEECRMEEKQRQNEWISRCAAGSSGGIRRVLMMNAWQGVAGGLHMDAIRRVLEERGVVVESLAISRHRMEHAREAYRRQVERRFLQQVDQFQPDLILSYGYHAPHAYREELADRMAIPWVQVVSNLAYYDRHQYPNEHTFVAEPHVIPMFERRGYRNVRWIPLMADYQAPRPVPTDGRLPLVFVGNSLWMPPEQQEAFWKRFQGREATQQVIRESIEDITRYDGNRHFYEWMQPDRIPDLASDEEFHEVFRFVLCQCGARRRLAVLERLAPYGLALFGGDWDAFLPGHSPLRACLRGYLPMEKEPEVFSYGRIFLNIVSVGCVDAPNMRFFNVPAMGGFQICDNPNLSRYLTRDKEIVFAGSIDEYEELVKRYLDDQPGRDEIRHAGWERVNREWTYRNWVDQVLESCNLRLASLPGGSD